MKKQIISVVTPVYNDWDSLKFLIKEIKLISEDKFSIDKIIVVNDGSHEKCPEVISNDNKIEIINLTTNMGHQRAICMGLCYVNDNIKSSNFIIVMDSDGEDRPSDIPLLIGIAEKSSSKIVFAKRKNRSEGVLFKVNYFFYKIFFKILTGDKINFGNFSCIPKSKIGQIISNPDSWNHYSGSILP